MTRVAKANSSIHQCATVDGITRDLSTDIQQWPAIVLLRRPMMCENTSCYVTMGQRGCVHGDASFHHDIVPECLWPSSSMLRVLE